MIICSASRRYLLLAGTIGTLAVAVWPAAAQQTPAASEAPPPWAQGRPEAAIGAKLAPIASPPLPTAADQLPIAKLKAPKGFKIEVYASGLANARSLRQGDKGTVFVSSRILDKVYAISRQTRQARGQDDRRGALPAERPRLQQRHALHRRAPQDLEGREDRGQPRQSAEAGRYLRRSAEATSRTAGSSSPSAPTTSFISMSARRAISACRPDAHAQIRRINLDGSSAEVVARGIRKIVGMDWHPVLEAALLHREQPRLAVGGTA